MDQVNVFDTPTTARLHRAEYLVGLAVTTGMIIANWGEIRWLPAIVLFLYIDLIGYIPGAIAYHRSKDKQISKVFYVLYNTMHSMITQGAVAALWCWLVKPEWALLVLPFHLFGDRGLFGNFYKPFGLHFEPVIEPTYQKMAAEVAARRIVLPLPADGTAHGKKGGKPAEDPEVTQDRKPVGVAAGENR